MPDPVVHHIELCVFDAQDTLNRLKKFGFNLFAKRKTDLCQQLVVKLGSIFFLITEKSPHYKPKSTWRKGGDGDKIVRAEPLTVMCCEDSQHQVDTVFNLCFSVKKSDVKKISEHICAKGGHIIQAQTQITDEKGTVSYSIVKSLVGNVVHTLLNTDDYHGEFLPGFEIIDGCESGSKDQNFITTIDHVTFAVESGNSAKVIHFYEKFFGMNRFEITSQDDENNGLIISEGVGLRLRAMEYWRCAEVGLSYNREKSNENSFLLVVVESLPGQTNCNVEAYLNQHRGEGIEHIAFKSQNIVETVSKLKNRGVVFRNPPKAYYDELRQLEKISGLGVNLDILSQFGILLDNEEETAGNPEKSGARGLGSGNILALCRSIREEERRNMLKSEAKTQEITKESVTSPRHC